MRYYLSLGSNLGEEIRNLERACRMFEDSGIQVIRSSSLYRTQPVGVSDQPWFVNQVIEISTAFRPQGLLLLIKKVEKELGRCPGPINGPRIIDIDILLAGDLVLETKNLIIPHPRMAQRNFVLVPLKEIAPRAVHPALKMTVFDLCRASQDSSIVRRISAPPVPQKRAYRGTGENRPRKERLKKRSCQEGSER